MCEQKNNIRDELLKLKQDTNTIACSPLLEHINSDFIDKIIAESSSCQFYNNIVSVIKAAIEKLKAKVDDVEAARSMKESYAEAYIFSLLRSKLNISPIIRSSNKTPDFLVTFRNKEIAIEFKSLSMVGGNPKYTGIMLDGLDSKIDLEDQRKEGKKVAISEQVIQPYIKSEKDYNPYSSRIPINEIVNKIEQNLKEDQFKQYPTILLVDFSDQLFLNSSPRQSIQQYYYGQYGENVSGILWHVAFGLSGVNILTHAEFEGARNSDGNQERNGILQEYNFIKGLSFLVENQIYSFSMWNEDNYDDDVNALLTYISKHNCHVSQFN